MDRQYVGIDFHRRRSVVVRMSAAGEKLSATRVANDPLRSRRRWRRQARNPRWWWRPLMGGCATRRHVAGWGARTHRWPVAAGR